MIDVSDEQVIAALAGSHTMQPQVTAYYNGEAVGRVAVIGGSVTFDDTAAVQGRCTLTVPVPDRVGTGVFDPRDLDVSGWRLFIEYGVVFGSVVKTVPLGTFVVYDLEDNDDGKGRVLSITGYDNTVLLRDGRFLAPYTVAAGQTYEVALEALASAINLSANYPTTTFTTPFLLFQEGDDRLQKMQDMSSSVGWTTVSDPFGVITARIDATSALSDAVTSFVEGPGCKMTSIQRKRTRQGVYNAGVVTGEAAGGAAPVYGIALDLDPHSLTYFYGPFGQVPTYLKSQYVTTTDQAGVAAQALLARNKGIGATLRIRGLPDPRLRPGDPARVVRTKMGVDQVVPLSSVTFSLTPGAEMESTTREGLVAA